MSSHTHSDLVEDATHLRVSVVVPTAGRPVLLERCLDALIRQTLDPACYEIIVVDDAPSDETQSLVMHTIARVLGRGPVIGYLASHGPHGPAAARNHGWRCAAAELIAFTDDDTVPDPWWLAQALASFEDTDIEAAWGRILMPVPNTPTDYELDAQGLECAEFATANCFCLKSRLAEVGGFDERFQLAWREDADLYFRLLRAQARIARLPDALVVHPVRPAPWGVALRQQKKVMFDALLYKKHPNLYREKIRARPRWNYYLTVIALAAVPIAAALGHAEVAAAAGATWLGMTAGFCWQRLRHTPKSARRVAEVIVTSMLIPPLAVFWRLAGALRFRAASRC